jgi:type I restriction enzyme M protein
VIPLRKEWRDVTNKPEEIVRQKFIRALVEHYGYSLEQMDQERRTQHGHKSPRTYIEVWQSLDDKTANRSPALIVECKTDTIEIQERDYYQGESYTRTTGCEFFIAINEIPKAADWGDAKSQKDEERARIEALGLHEEDEERQIEEAFSRLNSELLPSCDDNKPIDPRGGRLA